MMRSQEKKSRAFAKVLRSKMTDAEVLLWQRLRYKQLAGLRFRRQHPIGPYIADFACIAEKLVVEVDGETHGSDKEIARDKARTQHMEELGWTVIRVANQDIYEREDDALEHILSHFEII